MLKENLAGLRDPFDSFLSRKDRHRFEEETLGVAYVRKQEIGGGGSDRKSDTFEKLLLELNPVKTRNDAKSALTEKEYVNPLVKALARKENPLSSMARFTVIEILRDLKKEAKSAIPALMTLLKKDPDPGIRNQLVIALTEVDPENNEVISLLRKVSRTDCDFEVRNSATFALYETDKITIEDAPALGDFLLETRSTDFRKMLAFKGLLKIDRLDENINQTLPTIIELFRTSHRDEMETIKKALLKIGNELPRRKQRGIRTALAA